MGDLGLLPLEIRKEIYAYVFVQKVQKKIKIGSYGRIAHHRNPQPDIIRIPAFPDMASILRASKAINSEAIPVLYGDNRFWFMNPSVLAGFLLRIGNSKQHIRHITIGGDFCMWDSCAFTDRWVAALIGVNGLRTLKIYRCQLGDDSEQVTVRSFVAHCKPMFAPLQAAIEARGLNYSVFDILKVHFDHGHTYTLSESCGHYHESYRLDDDFLVEMKKEIVEQLGLIGK